MILFEIHLCFSEIGNTIESQSRRVVIRINNTVAFTYVMCVFDVDRIVKTNGYQVEQLCCMLVIQV